jgi:hypothetical protein
MEGDRGTDQGLERARVDHLLAACSLTPLPWCVTTMTVCFLLSSNPLRAFHDR